MTFRVPLRGCRGQGEEMGDTTAASGTAGGLQRLTLYGWAFLTVFMSWAVGGRLVGKASWEVMWLVNVYMN